MEGILECEEEIIQARKPFTEFILNREGEEDYAQFKDIIKQLSPGWAFRPLGNWSVSQTLPFCRLNE